MEKKCNMKKRPRKLILNDVLVSISEDIKKDPELQRKIDELIGNKRKRSTK